MKMIGIIFKLLTIFLEIAVVIYIYVIREFQLVDETITLIPVVLIYALSILLLIMIGINISTMFIKNLNKQIFLYFAIHWMILLIILFLVKLPIIVITGILFIAIVPVYFADYDEKVYWKHSTD